VQKGITLQELAAKLDAQAASKKDFISPTKRTALAAREDGVKLVLEDQGEFGIKPLAHKQIATFADIPAKYADKMLTEEPDLLAVNANRWLQRSDKSRMIRTISGDARAFLSNQYQRVQNEDLVRVALQALSDMPEVRFVSMEVTDARLYLQGVFPSLQGEIRVGDPVQAGFILTNSEVGLGSYGVSGLCWRLICLNGARTEDIFKRAHIGKAVEDSSELWADDTRAADDKVVTLRIRDAIKAVADESRFKVSLQKLQGLTQGEAKNPVAAVQVLSNKLGLTDGEKDGLLTSLIKSADLSRWGLVNATTSLAHTAKDYDRAQEIQAMGGQLIELDRSAWTEILEAKAA
jgi:hypothetical protein